MCPEPTPETRVDWVMDNITWESVFTAAEAVQICASKRLPSQTTSTEGPFLEPRRCHKHFRQFLQDGWEGSYLRIAYKVRIIPARQNPSKNLSVLNIVTFTDRATVRPKIRMKMMEQSSTGRRPTLCTERKR